MKISINPLDVDSIDNAIAKLEAYTRDLDRKAEELCERLAQMGALYAEWNFGGVMYAGDIDYTVSVERGEGNSYKILAGGQTVLFLEFGAGVHYGGGHPKEAEFGMGPGTYPGQTHALDPKGWYFKQGGNAIHTYGNPAGMPMWNAAQDLKSEILKVAQEVFQTA